MQNLKDFCNANFLVLQIFYFFSIVKDIFCTTKFEYRSPYKITIVFRNLNRLFLREKWRLRLECLAIFDVLPNYRPV